MKAFTGAVATESIFSNMNYMKLSECEVFLVLVFQYPVRIQIFTL